MANTRKSSSDLAGRVGDALAALVPCGSNLVIGLSGGLDSVVLTHLLATLAPAQAWRLRAVHVHHGISPHADDWAAFCAAFAASLDLPCAIERVDITPLRAAHGLEAAARQLRHDVLNRQQADFIALAHHRDDQAETLLLQLLRGAGVRGAAAMPLCKPRPGRPALLRPLLDATRAELHHYAERHGLAWVEDESNADTAYPRNFLRHQILPVLEKRFPAYRSTLARSAAHFAEAQQLLDELAAQDGEGAVSDGRLDIAALQRLNAARARNLLRYFLHARGCPMPDSDRLHEMWRQLVKSGAGSQLCITWQGRQLRCYRGLIHVLPERPPLVDWQLHWQGETVLELPQGLGRLHFEHTSGQGLALSRLGAAGLLIRNRRGSERGLPNALGQHVSLKNLFQSHGVPPWQRQALPLLFSGDELVAVAGVAYAAAYQAKPGEAGVQVRLEGWPFH